MAYLILHNRQGFDFYKIIAENDLQYHPNQYADTKHYVKLSITENEYLDFKKSIKVIDTATNQSVTFKNSASNFFQDADSLQKYIDELIPIYDNWQKNNPPENGYMTRVNNYLTFLKNFDVSSLSYPMTQSFESYLSSINQDYLIIQELV